VSARERQGPGKTGKGPGSRLKCPICRKPQLAEFRPFCSKHCADVDLGRWLDGRYAVPGAPAAMDETGQDGEQDDDG
jgi:endogenous inhibitor of DNA gyrase (YacG/DUF329 family)